MIETPRPSTMGEILDRTAHIYRTRFLVFLGIAAMPTALLLVFVVASLLFFMWMGAVVKAPDPTAIGIAAMVVFLVGTMVFLPAFVGVAGLGAGAMNHAAAAAYEDRKITIRGAYKAAWKRGWRYIGLLVLEGLILMVAPGVVWTILIIALAMGQVLTGGPAADPNVAASAAVLLLLGLLCLYALWMLILLCLAFPICVVENVGAGAALKRAVSLSKGTRGRLLVLYLLGTALRWGLSLVMFIPLILILTLIPGLNTPQHAGIVGSIAVIVVYGGGFLNRGVTKPIYTIAQMLFYFDQRIRKEGFDIEWMMRQAGMVAEPVPVPEAAPWMPPLPPKESIPPAPGEPAPQPAENPAAVETAPVGDPRVQPPEGGEPA